MLKQANERRFQPKAFSDKVKYFDEKFYMHKVRLFITENFLFVLSGHKGDFKVLAQQELSRLDQITMISSNSSILAVNFFQDNKTNNADGQKGGGKANEKQIYDFLFDTIRRTELIYYLINNTKKSLRKPTFVIEKGFNINK